MKVERNCWPDNSEVFCDMLYFGAASCDGVDEVSLTEPSKVLEPVLSFCKTIKPGYPDKHLKLLDD